MYQTTVDLNEVHPLTTCVELVDFENRLAQFGEERFSKDYRHEPNFTRALEKQREFDGVENIDLPSVPAEFKHATMYLRVYHSRDTDITSVFEHQTGAYCRIKTDRSSLHVTGPNQPTVDDYLVRLFEKPQEDTPKAEE